MNFLPGWEGVMSIAGAPKVSTLSQPTGKTATSTTSTITVPTGIQKGDLLYLKDTSINVSSPASTVVPSGFNTISNISASTLFSIRQIVSYKIADGTESSTNLTGMNGDTFNDKELIVFRGDVAITSVTVSGTVNGNATTGDPASQSTTASGGTAPLIVLAAYGSNGTVTTRTFSPAEDAELQASGRSSTKYKIYNSSPADTTVDMGDYGTNGLQSFYLECS